MTPVTVRCQPPSPFTRGARPPLQRRPEVSPAAVRRGHGGGAPPRASGVAARASWSPALPPPRLRTPPLPLPPLSAAPPLRPPCPPPALSGSAHPSTPFAA